MQAAKKKGGKASPSKKKSGKKGSKSGGTGWDVTYELGSPEHVVAMERAVTLEDDMQTVLWSMKDHPLMRASSRILPKMIMSVPTWDDPEVVKQAYAMLNKWAPLGTAEAMQLLDPSFWEKVTTPEKGFVGGKLDTKRLFRRFKDHAVECLATMGDGELEIYLLELCQLMKNEKLHNSALVRLLLYRGLRSPFTVGQSLFWHLRSEMHEGGGPTLFTLYGMFLRQYLERCGPHREELVKQEEHIQSLRKLVKTVKDTPAEQRLEVLRNECRELTFPPGGMLLPTGSQHAMRVIGLNADKCKYMDSAQKPLWLEYISADPTGENIIVIFKDGDDVRQDILVLQMFRIMEQLWEAESLDIPLSVYGTASLGFEVGFVEVVTHSNTLSNITKDAAGASGVWDKTILHKWLQEQNRCEVRMSMILAPPLLSFQAVPHDSPRSLVCTYPDHRILGVSRRVQLVSSQATTSDDPACSARLSTSLRRTTSCGPALAAASRRMCSVWRIGTTTT